MKIKIGTRGSKLALTQTNMVKNMIEEANPNISCEIVVIKTKGDVDLKNPIHKVGKGVFVKEIEDSLLRGDIDLAVHSMKDMPSDETEGLMFFDPPKAEDARDVLISSRKIEKLSELCSGIVGTGSLRRKLQLETICPNISTTSIRGNIETRMSKVGEEGIIGVVLAYAGILRGGYGDKVSYVFDKSEIVPSPCQGILAIQGRKNDEKILEIISKIRDEETTVRMNIERAFQRELNAGCHSPMGFNAEVDLKSGEAILRACFGDESKNILLKKSLCVKISEAEDTAKNIAREFKDAIGK